MKVTSYGIESKTAVNLKVINPELLDEDIPKLYVFVVAVAKLLTALRGYEPPTSYNFWVKVGQTSPEEPTSDGVI